MSKTSGSLAEDTSVIMQSLEDWGCSSDLLILESPTYGVDACNEILTCWVSGAVASLLGGLLGCC